MCFFIGAAFSCIVKLIKNAASGVRKPSVLTCFCVVLSIALLSFSLALIYISKMSAAFVFNPRELCFFIPLLLAGFLAFLFPRVFVPLFLVLYAGLTGLSAYYVSSRYGFSVKPLSVTVNRSSTVIDDVPFDFNVTSSAYPGLVVEVCTLPEKLLVPLPRTYFVPTRISVAGPEAVSSAAPQSSDKQSDVSAAPQSATQPAPQSSYKQSDVSAAPQSATQPAPQSSYKQSDVSAAPQSATQPAPQSSDKQNNSSAAQQPATQTTFTFSDNFFTRWMFSSTALRYIELKPQTVLPVLYRITPVRAFGYMNFKSQRLF